MTGMTRRLIGNSNNFTKGIDMPKMSLLACQGRLRAYDAAIDGLDRRLNASQQRFDTYEDQVEMKYLKKKFQREKEAFTKRHFSKY